MYKVKISKKGQITIPKELRVKFNFKEDIELVLIDTPEGILLKPKNHKINALRGLFRELDFEKSKQIITEEREKWSLE